MYLHWYNYLTNDLWGGAYNGKSLEEIIERAHNYHKFKAPEHAWIRIPLREESYVHDPEWINGKLMHSEEEIILTPEQIAEQKAYEIYRKL